jgi:hypothetical protein
MILAATDGRMTLVAVAMLAGGLYGCQWPSEPTISVARHESLSGLRLGGDYPVLLGSPRSLGLDSAAPFLQQVSLAEL